MPSLLSKLRAPMPLAVFGALAACNQGPAPELVRLELPEMVTTTDPARALVRARYPMKGSAVSPGPHDYAVTPADVATVAPDGAVACQKTGDAKVVVSIQGVKGETTLRCRLVDRVELGELPPLDVTRGPVTLAARALAKNGTALDDVPVVVSSERPSVVRVSGLTAAPLSVGETGLVARAGNAEKKLKARVVRTLNVEALPLDGGKRINMSLKEGKYELSVAFPSERTLSVEWRGAPYCAYRATSKSHRSNCVLQGKGGVVFDNPAFLASGSTEVSTQGVTLAEVP
ncbi:MAG TPA: hypothetical protein VFZ53_25995 [Polyangiaceae bacterium]